MLPGGYTDATGWHAPHVDLTAMGAGLMRRVLTTVFFPNYSAENAAGPMATRQPPPYTKTATGKPAGGGAVSGMVADSQAASAWAVGWRGGGVSGIRPD